MSLLEDRRRRRIDAYGDGELSPRARAALERRIDADPQARSALARNRALGEVVREVWNEGPAAPRADLVIQALRPEMARIDAELEDRPGLRSWWARTRELLGPVPLAAAGAAALLALAVFGPGLQLDPDAAAVAAAGLVSPEMTSPSAIYDLSQDGAPLMIFEAPDGSTVIWILEHPDSEALGALSMQEF